MIWITVLFFRIYHFFEFERKLESLLSFRLNQKLYVRFSEIRLLFKAFKTFVFILNEHRYVFNFVFGFSAKLIDLESINK